jgi:hypothetical protein
MTSGCLKDRAACGNLGIDFAACRLADRAGPQAACV